MQGQDAPPVPEGQFTQEDRRVPGILASWHPVIRRCMHDLGHVRIGADSICVASCQLCVCFAGEWWSGQPLRKPDAKRRHVPAAEDRRDTTTRRLPPFLIHTDSRNAGGWPKSVQKKKGPGGPSLDRVGRRVKAWRLRRRVRGHSLLGTHDPWRMDVGGPDLSRSEAR